MDASLNETLAQLQTLLDVQPITSSIPRTPEATYIQNLAQNGLFQQYTLLPVIQAGQSDAQIQLQPNFIPQYQFMVQVGLSDTDVMRIASQC